MYMPSSDIHEAGDLRQLKKLIDGDEEMINLRDNNGQTPLHKAAMNGWLECVSYLMEKGAVVNGSDIAGCTALHYAASNGYCEIAKYLIENGQANLAHLTNKGYTAKHMAKSRGRIHVTAFFNDLENRMNSTWRD